MAKKSAQVKRERKLVVDAVKSILKEKTASGKTKQEVIVSKCLDSLIKNGSIRDLKILTEILGENVIKMEVKQPQIVVESDEDVNAINSLVEAAEE